MQINRLFETVHMLLNKKSLTARELAEHFEVSIRTVYRDIETLTFAGIPVYSTRGKNGGIKLLDEYVLDKSIISKDEQNDILYALQSLKAANYPEVEETLEKMSVIFNKTSGNWIEVDFSEYGNEQKELFENIKNAIINKKVIRFEYYNSQGIKSERSAEPLKLKFKARAWYLSAFCRKSNEMRLFKIRRIKKLSVTEEVFERTSENFEIPENETKAPKVKITMIIDKSQAYRVYDEFSEKDVKVSKNGDFEITSELIENEYLYGYLLSFGEYMKITEPTRLKKILEEKVEKMRKNY